MHLGDPDTSSKLNIYMLLSQLKWKLETYKVTYGFKIPGNINSQVVLSDLSKYTLFKRMVYPFC